MCRPACDGPVYDQQNLDLVNCTLKKHKYWIICNLNLGNAYASKKLDKSPLFKWLEILRIIFAWFFGIFSTSKNKILLNAKIKENNTKISTTPNTYDESQHNTNASPTAPQLPSLHHNHPLSLVPWNFRNLARTNFTNSRPNYIQSPIHHTVTQQSQRTNNRTPPYHKFSISKQSFF